MQFNFDPNSVEKRDNVFELLPAGWYDAQVVESDINFLKTGNGQCLKLTFEVLTEGFRGRKVWVRLNVQHNNPTAEKIAQQQLRELCEAVGVGRMTDTSQLHNKPVSVKVKIRTDQTGQYEPQNEINAFKAIGSVGAPSAARGFGGAAPASRPPAAPFAAQPPAAAPQYQQPPAQPQYQAPAQPVQPPAAAPQQTEMPGMPPPPAPAPGPAGGPPPWARRAA